jgi:hypothetical protein
MQEGFAFYVDETKFFKFDFYETAKEILEDDSYRISTIIMENNNNDYEDKAIVCGAFIKYLITSFGIENFTKLWKTIQEDDIDFKTIYGKNFSNLENDFYTFLETKD